MARKRFKPAEREMLKAGVKVEYRVGRWWHPGGVVDGKVHDDDYGWQYMWIKNLRRTPSTLRYGEHFHGGPDSLRLPK